MTSRGEIFSLKTRSSKNEWIGQILSSSPPIAENIFKYLNVRQLNSCAQVCSLWNRLVQIEKKRRKDILSFLEAYQCHHHNMSLSLDCPQCEEREAFNFKRVGSIQQQLYGANSDPQFCLAFATECVAPFVKTMHKSVANITCPSEPPAKRRKEIPRYPTKIRCVESAKELLLKCYLPKECELAFCISIGIVGSHTQIGSVGYVGTTAISGLLFPKLPGVDIFKIPIDSKTTDLSSLMPSGKKPKCLLIFLSKETALTKSTSSVKQPFIKMVDDFVAHENEKVAVGGAVILTSSFIYNCYNFALAFSGDNVEAASVVLGPIINSKSLEEDTKKLQALKDCGLSGNRCIAFMFTHSLMIFHKRIIENSLFRKMFPQVPLLGIIGHAEIGNDYIPGISSLDGDEVPLESQSKMFFHCERTVYVLISFKN